MSSLAQQKERDLRTMLESTREKWEAAEHKCERLQDELKELRGRFGVLGSEVVTLRALTGETFSAADARKKREWEEERQMCENIRASLADDNERLRKQLADALFQLGLLKEKK